MPFIEWQNDTCLQSEEPFGPEEILRRTACTGKGESFIPMPHLGMGCQ